MPDATPLAVTTQILTQNDKVAVVCFTFAPEFTEEQRVRVRESLQDAFTQSPEILELLAISKPGSPLVMFDLTDSSPSVDVVVSLLNTLESDKCTFQPHEVRTADDRSGPWIPQLLTAINEDPPVI